MTANNSAPAITGHHLQATGLAAGLLLGLGWIPLAKVQATGEKETERFELFAELGSP